MAKGDRCGVCDSLIEGLFRDHTFAECRNNCVKRATAEAYDRAAKVAERMECGSECQGNFAISDRIRALKGGL